MEKYILPTIPVGSYQKRLMSYCGNFENCIEASAAYTVAVKEFKDSMTDIQRRLHRIPTLDDRFLYYGEIPEDDESSFKKSALWSGVYDLVPVNSQIFKGRFISFVLEMVCSNIEEIVEVDVDENYKSRGFKEKYICQEYKYRFSLLTQIQACLFNFISLYSKDKNYSEELMKIFELSVMGDMEHFRQKVKIAYLVEDEISRLEKMMSPDFFTQKSPDSAVLQNILMLACIVSTGRKNAGTFIVDEDISLRDTDRVRYYIEILGSNIMGAMNGRDIIYPELYRCFFQSLPKLSYKYKDINSNLFLKEGCRALAFIGFLASSKSISKMLRKII